MKNKDYKLILNIGCQNENIKYFDRLTKNRLNDMLESKNYIILYYDTFFKSYLAFDSKTTEKEKLIFNNNLEYYSM